MTSGCVCLFRPDTDPVMSERSLLVVSAAARLGPHPGGHNGTGENVLLGDGGAACSSREECGDKGCVCVC